MAKFYLVTGDLTAPVWLVVDSLSIAVLLSVFGYAIGNYAGYFCGILMQLVSQ